MKVDKSIILKIELSSEEITSLKKAIDNVIKDQKTVGFKLYKLVESETKALVQLSNALKQI